MGKNLIEYAERGDEFNFKRLLFEFNEPDYIYWHLTKAFKLALREKQVAIVRILVETVGLNLRFEPFEQTIHSFLFNCQEPFMMGP